MRKIAKITGCIFLLLFACAIIVIAQDKTVTVPLGFLQVKNGSMLVRDKDDRVYSAVIKSYAGFNDFKKAYPVDFGLSEDDFTGSFYVAGFSDSSFGIVVDGFKRQGSSSYYYLDIADSGIRAKVLPPPEGKKYTAYAIIRISDKAADKNKISHVQIREGLENGLTKWY